MSGEPSPNTDHFNAEAAGDIGAALRDYDALAAREAAGEPLKGEDKTSRDSLLNAIFAQRQLVPVTPDDADADLQAQLASADKKDKVHPVGTADDLRTHRLGHDGDSKQAYALVVPDGNGTARRILAIIYTHWSTRPEGAAGVAPADLPGKVDEILKEPSHPLPEKPNTVIFYSISSFMPRAGQTLIEDLHAHILREAHGQPMALSTLSPLRTLKKFAGSDDAGIMGDEELKDLALGCLLANRDPVGKFHLSNGAYVGDIKLHANEDGSADARDGLGVMVNYVYPADPASLARNKAAYRQGIIPLHPDLYARLAAGQAANAAPVTSSGRAAGNESPPLQPS